MSDEEMAGLYIQLKEQVMKACSRACGANHDNPFDACDALEKWARHGKGCYDRAPGEVARISQELGLE